MSFNKLQDVMQILPITEQYEKDAREVVLKGLEERFGFLDPAYNPDLTNILQSYSNDGAVFLIGIFNGQVVCTGAISPETIVRGRVGRMSVMKPYRRAGAAKQMIRFLESWAEQEGYRELVLETNNDWLDAIEFYKGSGYTLYLNDGKCSHFMKQLC